MDKTLCESLKKGLQEAIEHTESQCVIRSLHPNEKLPMDLLLLADPSKTSIKKYIHKIETPTAKAASLTPLMYRWDS